LTIMRILVTGASGQLGSYLVDQLVETAHDVIGWTGSSQGSRSGIDFSPVNLSDDRVASEALEQANPDLVIHAAAISSADAVRRDPARGWAVNVAGTRLLAEWTARRGRRLVFTSTDLVFGGSRSWSREEDVAEPILEYGRTKRAAEPIVLAVPQGLVVRISLLYGTARSAKDGYFDIAMAALRLGQPRTFFGDEFRTPIDYLSASRILVKLALATATGIVHLGGNERLSRFELMRRSAAAMGIDPSLVLENCRDDLSLPEPRPRDVSLDTSRLRSLLPGLDYPGVEAALASGPVAESNLFPL
jgi:dTDP-4-dehydrorhamnose reductase